MLCTTPASFSPFFQSTMVPTLVKNSYFLVYLWILELITYFQQSSKIKLYSLYSVVMNLKKFIHKYKSRDNMVYGIMIKQAGPK